MKKQKKTLVLAGAGLAAAAALGVTGATMAGASEATSATVIAGTGSGSDSGSAESSRPGRPGHGMRDTGGPLTAEAASKAIAAAAVEVDGGTVSGVHALSTGTYVVDVNKGDGTHVHVLLDSAFAVTSVEERGMGRGPGAPEPQGDDSTGSSDSTDANMGTTSLPTT